MRTIPRPVVLVVDDDPDIRRFLGRTLRRDFDVLQAEDGIACLELARHHRPEVIVLDLIMPHMGGLRTLAELTVDPRTSFSKVVMISGLDDVHSRVKALEGGAQDFIVKPVHPLELRARVTAATRREWPASPSVIAQTHFTAAGSPVQRVFHVSGAERLTHREKQLAEGIALGWTQDEISVRADISPGTVRSHKARIRRKLEVPPGVRLKDALIERLKNVEAPAALSDS